MKKYQQISLFILILLLMFLIILEIFNVRVNYHFSFKCQKIEGGRLKLDYCVRPRLLIPQR